MKTLRASQDFASSGAGSSPPVKEIPKIMTYSQRLYPWAVIHLLPQMQRVVVGRYRNRSDAVRVA